MAVSSSFKQKCPSCEAMVAIKDPGLVGKKVECSKCKYRFVVEDPIDQDKAAVKAGKSKAEAGAHVKLILGLALALVGVAVLGIAAWLILAGGSPSTSPPPMAKDGTVPPP